MRKNDYPGTVEVVPGVFIAEDAVYIADDEGEVATWNIDEVIEDNSAFQAAMVAIALAAADGPEAVRDNIASKGERLTVRIERTALGIDDKDKGLASPNKVIEFLDRFTPPG